MDDKYYIYIHKNKINKKIYVGQTKSIKDRWKPTAYEKCSKFYNAIQKYGWENFEHIILKNNLTLDEANYWETYYIKYFNTVNNGYNLNYGGNNKGEISESTREKLSKKSFQLWQDENYRKKQHESRLNSWTEERKKRMSEQMTGKNSIFAKKIYCETTNEFFDSMADAERKYGINHGGISACCQNKRKSAGKHPITGEKMVWRYIND